MKPRDALFAGLGAWSVVAAMHLASRYAGRHFLSIIEKEV